MILKKSAVTLILSFIAMNVCLQAEEKKEAATPTFTIQGEVPEGWEVVELSDAPAIEKWIETKEGEKKKVLVKPFGLKPVVDKDSNFTVSNPLENASGQDITEVLEAQSMNLAQSDAELSSLLNRLKALLQSLPATTESK